VLPPPPSQGIVIEEPEEVAGRGPLLHYYPEIALPREIHERLHKLFDRRKKWLLHELSPYLR